MTERSVRTAAVGCLQGDHNHRMLAVRHPLDRDGEPGPEFLLTLWLCPVLRSLGALVEDQRPPPESAGGPLP